MIFNLKEVYGITYNWYFQRDVIGKKMGFLLILWENKQERDLPEIFMRGEKRPNDG